MCRNPAGTVSEMGNMQTLLMVLLLVQQWCCCCGVCQASSSRDGRRRTWAVALGSHCDASTGCHAVIAV